MTHAAKLVSRFSLPATALMAACLLMACPPKTKVDAGVDPMDASVDVDAGQPVDSGTPADAGLVDAGPPPELKVKRLLPPRGPTAGGSVVAIEGSGFLRDFAPSGTQAKRLTTLKFGSNPVLDFDIIDDETMELRTPPGITGPVSVSIQNPNGRFVCNNCFTYFEELVVTSFSPAEGPLAGGNVVTINGQGFTADVQVLFANTASPEVTLVSPTQVTAVVPRGVSADQVDLVLYNKNGVSTQRRGYHYIDDGRLSAVIPLVGPIAGGTDVSVRGTGFTGATAVKFGATAATAFSVVSDSEITATTPAVAAGAVNVQIVTPRGTIVGRNAFTYVDASGAFAVFGVYPHVIRAGMTVTLTGQALNTPGLNVTIGGVAATLGTATSNTLAVTIPARGTAPRKSDVVITGGGTATLTAGVTWRIGVSEITPVRGPAAGGTAVTGTGTALPVDAEVYVGALKATATMVTSETALSFTTPKGSGGPAADLRVRELADPENEFVFTGAFTFEEPLSIGRVQPDRGAIAGNTLITVLGAGFGESTVVYFGVNRAKDIKVVDSHTMTVRTPKGEVGTIDVKVERLTQNDLLPGGFSYFDPRSISGGLSGGPLVGTLNVTVLDGTRTSYGAPIALATVLLGNDPTTPLQGLTDRRGQVTFSDPSLVKAQTVTVFKEGFESTTVTSVNAENLTVFISNIAGGEPNPGPPPMGTPASQISGRVTGFKSPRPLVAGESLAARVFVAQTSLFGGAPFSGVPNRTGQTWQVTHDGGNYLVLTGAGLRATYAVLGIVSSANGSFTPVAMGVKRGITTTADNPAVNQDIVLDMTLDQTVPITVDSPLEFPDMLGLPVPGTNSIYSWLDLGAEGFIPNPNNWDTGMSSQTSVTSTDPTLSFPNFPQLDGSNFIFMNDSEGTGAYPVSYYFRRQPGALTPGVTIGPMLPTPMLVEPATQFTGTIRWTLAPGAIPNIYNVQILKPTPFGNVSVWNLVLPGTETQVVLPQPAVDQLHAQEAGNQLFVVIYASRAPKFAYNQWTYDTLSGVSWSSFTISVSAPFTP